jgi:hypothetical protein
VTDNDTSIGKTSRRRFLLAAGKGAVGLACAGFLCELALKDDFIARAVRKRLPYLLVDDGELLRFAADFRKQSGQGRKKTIAVYAISAPFYRILARLGRDAPLTELEDQIAQSFLMSCDLFSTGKESTSPVRYVRLYDPYEIACSNPFARKTANELKIQVTTTRNA